MKMCIICRSDDNPSKENVVEGEQWIYPDHQKEERLDLVEIGDFLSFRKMQIRFHMTLQKKNSWRRFVFLSHFVEEFSSAVSA